MSIRIGINGLGRIGRSVARAIIEEGYKDIELVAANGPAPNETHAHLLQYDSVHGRFRNKIKFDDKTIDMGRGKFAVTHSRDPNEVNWKKLGVDIVLECSGAFNSKSGAALHLKQGAKRVIISAPAGEDCPTFVLGVNDHKLRRQDTVFSIGSCTTNALAPVAKILNDRFGIVAGYMTTVHAYTGDQNLVDGSHKDLRRARGGRAFDGADENGRGEGHRPRAAGARREDFRHRDPRAGAQRVDDRFDRDHREERQRRESERGIQGRGKSALKGVLAVADEPLVSMDFNHDTNSAIVDLTGTAVVGGNLLRVAAWYDNEWGFSCRMLDMVRKAAKL